MGDISKRVKIVLIMILAMTILCATIEPALAASSSLPEGAHLGNGMGTSRFGFRSPFMGGFGGPFGGMWGDMDDMDFGFMGSMGPYGFMNPWMMRGMGMGMGFGLEGMRERFR